MISSVVRQKLVVFTGRISGLRVQRFCANMENRLKIFQEIGLSEQKAKETVKNEKLAAQLETIVGKVLLYMKTTLWPNNIT